MHTLRFQLIGPFRAFRDETVVTLPKSRKARALLAYLASHDRPVSRDTVIALFFDDVADPKGALRWSLSRLRAVLGKDALVTQKNHIAISGYPVDSDVNQLEALLEGNASVADLAALEQTLEGEFLADLHLARLADFENWRLGQVVRSNQRLSTLYLRLAESEIGSEAGVEYARKLVAINPSDEAAWAQHVRALQALNRLDEARQVQQRAVVQLEREGVLLRGELASLWQERGAQVSRSPWLDIEHLQPRVVVLPTQCSKKAARLGQEMSEMLFRAASVNKTLTVVAPMVAENANGDYSAVGDLVLQSALSMRQGTTVLTAELADAASFEVLTTWRCSLDAQDRNPTAKAEAFFCARFEIDLPIALVSRVRNQAEETRSALDDYLLALPRIFTADGFDPEGAYSLLERSLAKKPHFGLASCALSLIRNFMPQHNDDEDELEITVSLARRAVETSQDDAFALGIAAIVVGHQADTGAGLHIARRGLSINPFSIMSGVAASMIAHYSGDDDAAWNYLDTVESHSDTDPVTFFVWTCRSMICYQRREYEQALEWGHKAVGQNPRFIIGLRYLLASLGQVGMVEEGKALSKQLVSFDPSETLDYFRRRSAYSDKAAVEHLCEGLAKAGLT